MRDHHRRVSAAQLKIGEDAIKVRLKGLRYRLYKRVNADQGVYTKGNEVAASWATDSSSTETDSDRCAWGKERVLSIIGQQRLESTRSYSS